MLYQRKLLSDMSDLGDPAPLPEDLVGLADDSLADLTAAVGAAAEDLGYAGQGFFPVAPAPPPAAIRWLHKAILLQRIPAEKRMAIRVALKTDPIIEDFLDLLYQADDVDLDNANLIAGLGYLVTQELLTADDVTAIRA